MSAFPRCGPDRSAQYALPFQSPAPALASCAVSPRTRLPASCPRPLLHPPGASDAIAHDHRAKRDAGIHPAGEIHIANRPGICAANVGFQFRDDLHCPDLWSARNGPGRETGAQGVETRKLVSQCAFDAAHDMHDMREPLDLHQLRNANGSRFRDATNIVATKIDQHECSARSFSSAISSSASATSSSVCLTAWSRARDRMVGDDSVLTAHQQLR